MNEELARINLNSLIDYINEEKETCIYNDMLVKKRILKKDMSL